MKRMTLFSKLLIIAVVLGGGFGLFKVAQSQGFIPSPGVVTALIPQKAVLPDIREALVSNVEPIEFPTSAAANVPHTLVRGEIWEWNAQMGLIFANGGSTTTKGSLMEKHGVNLVLVRQDDTSKMQEDLISCAREVANGATQCSNGANFVVIMGDGAGQFIAAINPQLTKLGPDFRAEVIGSPGYSRGEDAFMAPPDVKNNPQAARGLLVEGVLRDGDWNIALKWAGDNGLKNNPDEKTWDPDAINWLNAPDYNTAAADYVAGKCDDRQVVRDGHLTGETKHVCVGAVVTWTPGDVTVAKGKGGLVKVVSSKQYRSQMPAVIVGPKRFFEQNRAEIEGLLAATFEAGDQIKAFDKTLHKAAALSAKAYNDQDEDYWYRYYKGVTETDAQGLKVELGGSTVNNLADNLILFGLTPGTNDNFRSTYTVFSNIATQQYPALFASTPIPDVKEVENKSFILGAQARMSTSGAEGETTQYAAEENGPVVSKRSYSINFETGKAAFTPDGVRTMQELKDSLAITGLFIRVDGFTDSVGNDEVNQSLSEARASAVKNWLQRHAPSNFPDGRFAVKGYGSQKPVANNATVVGRAANRRVEITLLGN